MKVLLIDDHPLILAALQSVIRGLDDETTVVGAETAEAARAVLQAQSDFDLVLLDLKLGEVDGFDVLKEFRVTWPALPVVVLSASEAAGDVIRAIDAGAMGFVPKRASNATLFEALALVMTGGIYVPPMALGGAPTGSDGDTVPSVLRVGGETTGPGVLGPAPSPAPARTPAVEYGLTPRQSEVLGLLLKGHSNKLIAREMELSVETVKDHVAAVLRAVGVSSRTQAVLAVSQRSGSGAWRRPG